jgi:hypothetical protein
MFDERIQRRELAAARARREKILLRVQRDLPCPVPHEKINPFALTPNQIHISRHPTPLEGRIAIVTDAGRDAVDAGGASDEGAGLRTVKSCGPDAPTLASSLAEVSA